MFTGIGRRLRNFVNNNTISESDVLKYAKSSILGYFTKRDTGDDDDNDTETNNANQLLKTYSTSSCEKRFYNGELYYVYFPKSLNDILVNNLKESNKNRQTRLLAEFRNKANSISNKRLKKNKISKLFVNEGMELFVSPSIDESKIFTIKGNPIIFPLSNISPNGQHANFDNTLFAQQTPSSSYGGANKKYTQMTLTELRALARTRDIKGRSKMNKQELIDALRARRK